MKRLIKLYCKLQKAMYDKTCLDGKIPKIPEWMSNEPKKKKTLHHFVASWAKSQIDEQGLSGGAYKKALDKKIEKMKKNQKKCQEKYDRHCANVEKARAMWFEQLNDFQKELLEDYQNVSTRTIFA